MVKVVVDRQRWLRGDKDSYLLRGDGKMCCIGFLCTTQGLREEQIRGIGTLESLAKDLERKGEAPEAIAPWVEQNTWRSDYEDFTETYYTDTLNDLYLINDKVGIPGKEREARLKQLGEDVGIEFEFVN